ncbi:hypothetical protein, partial [Paenibacillus silagei]|uniref:hypothetical protein n=1 Tax=Paenibacillus silagei TaxID=1670801 RepID=UPI001AE12325
KTKRSFGAVGLFLSKSSLRHISRYFYFRIKPITFGAAEACGPDMVEKPITFGAAEACGPDMVEKPTTFGAAEACGPNVVEKPITMGMPQAFCSCFKAGIGLGGGACELSERGTNMCMKNRIQWRVRRRVGGCMSKSESCGHSQ